jgi:hypothetical protein
MQPYWQRLAGTLEEVSRTVKGLDRRATDIDAHMHAYETIRAGADTAARALTVSAFKQFFAAGFILAIAAFASMFNYQLLAPALGTLMQGHVGALPRADMAAGFVTLLQVGMGLVILESLRMTRLLPLIGGLDDMARTRLLTGAAGILLALTALEASLAFSTAHELLPVIAAEEAATGTAPLWLSSIMLMLLGTVLPLVLAFVAIPLEAFINAARTVARVGLAAALRLCAFVLRLGGVLALTTGAVAVRIYDLIIFAPLWVEALFRGGRKTALPEPEAPIRAPLQEEIKSAWKDQAPPARTKKKTPASA